MCTSFLEEDKHGKEADKQQDQSTENPPKKATEKPLDPELIEVLGIDPKVSRNQFTRFSP